MCALTEPPETRGLPAAAGGGREGGMDRGSGGL